MHRRVVLSLLGAIFVAMLAVAGAQSSSKAGTPAEAEDRANGADDPQRRRPSQIDWNDLPSAQAS